MSPIEKTFYGLILTGALTFGGMLYKFQTDRIGVLEAHAESVKIQRALDQVTLARMELDLKYVRLSMERMEQKLDTLILPPILAPHTPRRTPSVQAP